MGNAQLQMALQYHTTVVITDHGLLVDLLSPVLKQHSLEVISTFPAVKPGLAYILANPPALVIVDAIMPTLRTLKGDEVDYDHPYVLQDSRTSLQAVHIIRAKCPHTKVLLLTDEMHPYSFLNGLHAGAHGVASKIDGLLEFIQILERLMAGETRVLSNRVIRLVAAYERDPIPELTDVEVKILELAQEGYENPEIGRRLGYSAKTIRNKFHEINQKLHTHNRFEAVEMAIEIGLVGWRTGGIE